MAGEVMFARKTQAGEVVIKQGESGDIVYIIESGKYEAFLEQVMNS